MRSLVARIVRSPAESLSPHSLRVDERRDYPASLRNIADEATRAIAVEIRRLYGNNSIQEAREDSGIGTGRTRESGSNRATRFNKVQSRFRMNEQEKLPSNSFFVTLYATGSRNYRGAPERMLRGSAERALAPGSASSTVNSIVELFWINGSGRKRTPLALRQLSGHPVRLRSASRSDSAAALARFPLRRFLRRNKMRH